MELIAASIQAYSAALVQGIFGECQVLTRVAGLQTIYHAIHQLGLQWSL